MTDLSNNYIPRELSWLSFNGRVLQEAADPSVPLIERVRFLGIYQIQWWDWPFDKNMA